MVTCHRLRGPGAPYLFTVALCDRPSDLLVAYADTVRAAIREVRRMRPFTINAIAVLPVHRHAVWSLPRDADDATGQWREVQARFTRC